MKAVIHVAGLGTRLLPATKEQFKEMLPVFAKARNGHKCLKPLVLVFERLYELALKEFYFIIRKEKHILIYSIIIKRSSEIFRVYHDNLKNIRKIFSEGWKR